MKWRVLLCGVFKRLLACAKMKFVVTKDQAKQRLDVVVTEEIGKISRAFIGRLINDGKITVNGQTVKNGYKLRKNDLIEINYDLTEEKREEIELPVIYEDDDVIVLNKPEGILSHSKGAFNPEGTVASFIVPKLTYTGDRAGIVHRLDRATSGVIICAKTPEATEWLQKQFSQRKVKKTYLAVISGAPEIKKALIEVPIERNPHDPKSFRPGNAGKPALTEYEVAKEGSQYSLLTLKPTTGRTHQLRVHLKFIGFPIVGDPVYGGEDHERMLLHAEKLEITLPNGHRKVFKAPVPQQFHDILEV